MPTAIAGLYGVTFPNISELRVPHGYAVVVGVMLLMCLGLYVRFRKLNWL